MKISDLFSPYKHSFFLPRIDESFNLSLASDIQLAAVQAAFEKNGLVLSEAPNLPAQEIFPLKLKPVVEANFADMFGHLLVANKKLDDLCLSTEQMIYFVVLNRDWMVKRGKILFSCLTKLNGKYRVVVLSVTISWIHSVIQKAEKRGLVNPSNLKIERNQAPGSQPDLIGLTGKGNTFISHFPLEDKRTWSKMIVLCPHV